MMKNSREVMQNVAMITQLGISMLAPVILCVFIGYFLDEKYGWSTTVPLLFLGILAGGRNCYLLLLQILKDQGGKKHDK